MSPFAIHIICDDPRHAPREVSVTNFIEVPPSILTPGGGWSERPSSKAMKAPGAGHHLAGTEVLRPGWALDSSIANADVRTHFEMLCRKCRRRPIRVLPETLFPELDGLRAAGVSEIPLRVLAANISE